MIDVPRLYKNGASVSYFIDNFQVMIWQPAWLKLVSEEKEETSKEELDKESEYKEKLDKESKFGLTSDKDFKPPTSS